MTQAINDYKHYLTGMAKFCYWQAKSLPDLLIVYFNLILTLFLTFLAVRYFKATAFPLRRRVRAIYIGVALWIVTNVTKNLYSIIIYHSSISQGTFTMDHSKLFAILDTPPAIVVQTLLLAIPYIMWKNVMSVLFKMKIERSIQEQEFLNHYTFYLTIRFVILFFPWLALIIMPVGSSSIANFVKIGLQLLDSLISNILLLGSLSAFLRRFTQIKIDSQEDKKRLKWQYALMVASSSFRFIIDLAFLIILPQFQECECISPITQHFAFSLGYTFFGTITMHFIPIGGVLYIYKPTDRASEEQQSLIEN